MIYYGIDPGKGGGIAAVGENGDLLFADKMPDTERGIFELLSVMDRDWRDGSAPPPRTAVLELVRSSPQMGVVSVFTFGRNYGALRMALAAHKIPFEEHTPAKWQGMMRCRSGGDKNVTKQRAQELFPDVKCTHNISDALLLAEFCRRLHKGLLGVSA